MLENNIYLVTPPPPTPTTRLAPQESLRSSGCFSWVTEVDDCEGLKKVMTKEKLLISIFKRQIKILLLILFLYS